MTSIAVGGASHSGLRRPNYVNGRLLTAQDLTAEQTVVLARERWLGLAIGSGVAEGLEVSGLTGSSVLQVSPGTGVSPGGTAVHLDAIALLDLTAVTSSAPVDGVVFGDCTPASTSAKAPSAGAYVLVMRPATSYEGKVPVMGSPTSTLPTPCTSRWKVEDVVFFAIRLDDFTVSTTVTNRRNLLAHWCFGSTNLEPLTMSRFTSPRPYSGLGALVDLTSCDVPLGVFDWDGAALVFVDGWSARRRPVRPSATVALAAVVSDERSAEGEARFLQFQDQLDSLLATPAGRSVRAIETFPLLPAAGLVPIEPIAAAQPLMGLLPDFEVIIDDDESGFKKKAASRSKVKQLLELRRESGGSRTGGLGALSQQLFEMQQDIDALENQVAALNEQLAGGGRDARASSRAERQQLAETLLSILADTIGDGVDPVWFFSGIELRIGVVDQETVDFTICRSWHDGPIQLGTGAVLNVFFVMSSDRQTVAPYLLFVKRQRGVRWVDLNARMLDG